jgi:hypothetical protein
MLNARGIRLLSAQGDVHVPVFTHLFDPVNRIGNAKPIITRRGSASEIHDIFSACRVVSRPPHPILATFGPRHSHPVQGIAFKSVATWRI